MKSWEVRGRAAVGRAAGQTGGSEGRAGNLQEANLLGLRWRTSKLTSNPEGRTRTKQRGLHRNAPELTLTGACNMPASIRAIQDNCVALFCTTDVAAKYHRLRASTHGPTITMALPLTADLGLPHSPRDRAGTGTRRQPAPQQQYHITIFSPTFKSKRGSLPASLQASLGGDEWCLGGTPHAPGLGAWEGRSSGGGGLSLETPSQPGLCRV